jgi:hypothetical protein
LFQVRSRLNSPAGQSANETPRYGKSLVESYNSFKAAEREISEQALSLTGRWRRISLQLQILKEIWSSLDEEHQRLQDEVLQILVQKLQHAVLQISKAETRHDGVGSGRLSRLKQWKYAFTVKEILHSVIDDLKEWQAIFDPSWYLIIRVASPLIDVELARPRQPSETALSVANRLRQALTTKPQLNERIFLPASGIAKFQDTRILFSEARTMLLHQVGSSSSLILDHAECHPDANLSVLTQDIRALARQLRHTEPIKFCLLECFGVVKNQDENTGRVDSFDFIFRIPRDMRQPRSLRDHLCAGDSYSLSDVFAIAKRLALSVSYAHIMGFVHKNIQPETVLIFDDGRSPLGWSALVGFRTVRMADGKTLRHGDAAWDRNLYRHPDRQGLLPDTDYAMQHDIHSLGVCLLEIGLWRSLVAYDDPDGSPSLARRRPAFRTLATPT